MAVKHVSLERPSGKLHGEFFEFGGRQEHGIVLRAETSGCFVSADAASSRDGHSVLL